MDKKGVGGVVVMLFVSLFALGFTLPVLDHNSSVQHNEPVEATVIDTDIAQRVNDDDREYRPVITYEYTVGGETYTETNVYPGRFERWHGSESAARDIVQRYESRTAVGKPATAYYDPQNPGNAYLHNPGWPDVWIVGLVYVFVGAVAGRWYILKGFRRWRQRQLIQNTPTERIQSLSVGMSEITGTVLTEPDGPMEAPFTDEECVIARYEIEEYDGNGDDTGWETVKEGVELTPFSVDDGTGSVLVRPDEDATIELTEDWTEVYVGSDERGPPPVREFVQRADGVDFPGSGSGRHNDRKYRQRLLEPGEESYVFGTVQPRADAVETGASQEDQLVVQNVEGGSMRQPLFLISDAEEESLIERREWALWRLPVGGFFLVVSFVVFLFLFGPLLGLEMPRAFDGVVDSVS